MCVCICVCVCVCACACESVCGCSNCYHTPLFLHLFSFTSLSSHPLLVLESYRTRFNRAEGASDDPELAALAQLVESQCKVSGSGSKLPTTSLSVRGGLRISTTAASAPPPSTSTGSKSFSSAYATAAACNHSGSVTDAYYVDPEQSGKLLVLFRMMQVLIQ